MKFIYQLIYGFLLTLPLFVNAQTQSNDEVHYIGFNKLIENNLSSNLVKFDDYISKLKPIMTKYGMSLSGYNVTYGGSLALQADIVTFGSAPNMQAMQRFFSDPEFQAIFPILLSVTEQHEVVFTDNSLVPDSKLEGHTLLSLNWLKDNGLMDKLRKLDMQLDNEKKHFGVEKLKEASGTMSNRGLGGDIENLTPPENLQVWRIQDAHGYFDSKQFKKVNLQAKQYLERVEDFWIEKRF